MKTKTIADFIEAHLRKINAENIVKVYTNENSAITRVREAAERYNAQLNNNMGFEGITLSEDDLQKIKVEIPTAFKKSQMFEAIGTKNHFFGDGSFAGQTKTKFAIEVIL
jgi:hypothetical protein